MKVSIQPSRIGGTVMAPASKSAMQRACALALLHTGDTIICNPGKSDDDLAALQIIQELGASVNNKGIQNGIDEGIIINSPGLKARAVETGETKKTIHCGESGLSLRMFTPIAALGSGEITITGAGSLLHRPVDLFDEILPQLGISVKSGSGKLPLLIKGPLVPADITIDGSLSSQFLTGLLLAFARTATKRVVITVINLKSRPYIDLTLQMLKQFGYLVENDNYERFHIQPHAILPGRPITYTVEGDWSAAAFLLVAGAVAPASRPGQLCVTGLDIHSTQADRAILQALMMAGVVLSMEEKRITVRPSLGGRGKAFHFNATDCPDLFPPLVALALNCVGDSVIEGIHRLTHKESNRALTLQEEFRKMGADIRLQDDLMLIKGGKLNGAILYSHQDHRVAMACAIAALNANGETVIEGAGAINKSYPEFYQHLKMLGGNVSLPTN